MKILDTETRKVLMMFWDSMRLPTKIFLGWAIMLLLLGGRLIGWILFKEATDD